MLTNLYVKLIQLFYFKLGGFQFDRELRAIINYLTSATTWSIRDKFSKLKHITIILNLDNVNEINEYFNSNSPSGSPSGMSMMNLLRLTPNEVRQVMKLRNDFSSDDIKKLRL